MQKALGVNAAVVGISRQVTVARLCPDVDMARNSGVTPGNQPYVRQMNEAAARALQRCAPYKLPADLYEGGWEDLIFTFRPMQMS